MRIKTKRLTSAAIAVILLASFGIKAGAQQVENSPQKSGKIIRENIEVAKELYNNKLYNSAIKAFDEAGISNDITEGYRTLCLIHLNSPNAHNAAGEYEKKYPHSPLCDKIRYSRAMLLFDEGNYAKACQIMEEIDKKTISKDERTGFNFRKAYCKMRTGSTSEAMNIFNGIISEGNTPFLTPSLYYCGYLHYVNRDFQRAIPLLERAQNDPRFNLLSRYHLLESKFMLKEYEYATTAGPILYESTDDSSRPKVARIVSEAYYALNQPEKARYYFELYSLSGKSMSRSDNFYAGMIAYTLNNHVSAVDAFSKVAGKADSIGQNAAYHLGQSYIQLKNKLAAQKAFKLASESGFDPAIKEDAFFNYAKLSFDINRNMAPIGEYLKLYPYTDLKWNEIHSYIATEFIMNGNYADAIVALKKISNHTSASRQTLQKASFLRAMQLIRSGSFEKAIPHLTEAAAQPTGNTSLKNLCHYWLAECHYRRDDFDKSMEILSQLQKSAQFRNSKEYLSSIYNMAYNLFKKGDFTRASTAFQNYLGFEPAEREYTNEARLRVADCMFMERNYSGAAELYEKLAVEQEYADLYAPFQASLAYGLVDNNTKKCALLEEITGNRNEHISSPLYSQALYELARTRIQNVEDEKAERVLARLLDNPKDSLYYYKAMIEMGMINANRKDYTKALDYYKKVVEESPLSEEGQSALAGIENIYQSQNRPQEFLAYLDQVGLSSVKSPDERESMLFNSAEQIFLSGNYTGALAALGSYLEQYPAGSKNAQANFYMAECYNKEGKIEKAANYYYKVMETQDGAFSEIATLNYGRLSFALEKYQEAVNAYETLGKIAQLENNKLEAQIGKMRSYFMCRNYGQAAIEAKELLSNEKADASAKRSGKYFLAKSSLALDNRSEAIGILKELAEEKSDVIGAEATYLLIENEYDAGNFTNVQNLTFAFSDSATPHSYWLAKSFIILGDSYVEEGNIEQAKATFNSVKENYEPQTETDDIQSLLKIRLEKLAKLAE